MAEERKEEQKVNGSDAVAAPIQVDINAQIEGALTALQEKLGEDPQMSAALRSLGESLDALRQELEQQRAKADDYLRLLQRVQADFINYRRRAEQERSEQTKFANALLVTRLLPVLDDFDRARISLPLNLSGLTWLQGLFLIERKLKAILEQEGVAAMEAEGKDFDPLEHEAVLYEEADEGQVGKVIGELQRGYKMHDRVLRPALVKVGKARAAAAQPPQ